MGRFLQRKYATGSNSEQDRLRCLSIGFLGKRCNGNDREMRFEVLRVRTTLGPIPVRIPIRGCVISPGAHSPALGDWDDGMRTPALT
jgi:hypothetical protein